jgi:peptidyl-prolyl cis-trans isomerase B (cyclophilin B)
MSKMKKDTETDSIQGAFSTQDSQSSRHFLQKQLKTSSAILRAASLIAVTAAKKAVAEDKDMPKISRSDVGFINLNTTEPVVTDIVYMDIVVGDDTTSSMTPVKERIEISLYGTVCPKTVENFKVLCANAASAADGSTYGYKGSELFRVISSFSVQGGSIGAPATIEASKRGRFGRSAINNGQGFVQENFRILHSYEKAGVVSMMKDIVNKNLQDSRFFVTFEPYASWADEKYVAFGRVSKGMQFLQSLQIVPVQSPANYPLTRLRIMDCGVVPQ